MDNQNIGNRLNQIVDIARAHIFNQGEIAQLTYWAFDLAACKVDEMEHDEAHVTFPVGYKPDKTTIDSTRTYKKSELSSRYRFLAQHQLAVNALIQLVTIVETTLGELVRAIVSRYPKKLGGKRQILIQTILEAASLEEVHLKATDALWNEISYKSPQDLALALQPLISINLLECPSFHCYMEAKASRDIFVHNQGIANEVYLKKSASHARVQKHIPLPATVDYFLQSYEHCLLLIEWIEEKIHEVWHSSDYEERKNTQPELPLSNINELPTHT